MGKVRLDVFLHERGYYPSREKARAAIMAGEVYVEGRRIDKAGTGVDANTCAVEIVSEQAKYVGRGGQKLEKALEVFDFNVTGKTFLDIGASTGGFTDCLLQNGAKKVYAIDVGYGQLDYTLRTDERVVVVEKTNFRYLTYDEIGEKADGFVMDVSFISVLKLTENLKQFLKPGAGGIFLIKPQFEATRAQIEKKGIIKDKNTHISVLHTVVTALNDSGWHVKDITFSPIAGAKGNIEFLLYATLESFSHSEVDEAKILHTVNTAHQEKDEERL